MSYSGRVVVCLPFSLNCLWFEKLRSSCCSPESREGCLVPILTSLGSFFHGCPLDDRLDTFSDQAFKQDNSQTSITLEEAVMIVFLK